MSTDVRETSESVLTPAMEAARQINSTASACRMAISTCDWGTEWINRAIGAMYRRQVVIDGVDAEEIRNGFRRAVQHLRQVEELLDEVRIRSSG